MGEAWAREVALLPFTPLQPRDGYLPIKDHGLIGDGSTAALVGRDGSISWLCLPRFDSPALFCRLLDVQRGGGFTIAPDDPRAARQAYVADSGVLVTELRGPDGMVRIIDAMTFRPGADLVKDERAARGELLRLVEVVEGSVRLNVNLEPRGGAEVIRQDDGWRLLSHAQPALELRLAVSRPLHGPRTRLDLKAGDRLALSLCWAGDPVCADLDTAEERIRLTIEDWRAWARNIRYEGPQRYQVRRSAFTLKLLDHFENGAILAAPTSSLPEKIGGVRNWDYRYSWVRDAAFTIYAFRRIGLHHEALSFDTWVLDAIERGGRPRVLYNVLGEQPEPEWQDPELEGYRRSRPVRWGNAAAEQHQHDVFGEILDCAFQRVRAGGELQPHLWQRLRQLIEQARQDWRKPDHGIWEVRSYGRPFTYSAALCQVALDRGSRLAAHLGLPGDVVGWRGEAARIRSAILEEAWDEHRQALVEQLGGGGLDASVLSLPLRRVLPADQPRMQATTAAIVKHLGAGNGLLYRYNPDESPDGLPGHEGAFVLCSFWLVDNLALQGRLDEALELYDSLCDRASPLGLLPEEIDPVTGEFLGNFPQALSHIGVVSSGVTLTRLLSGITDHVLKTYR